MSNALGLRRFWRAFTGPREAVILAYHRVASLESDPWSLAVSPAHFDEQLELLRKTCRVLSLAECLRLAGDNRLPRRAVAVTFDDGYADNYYNALPELERHDIPATVFVLNGAVGRADELWWDELERILLHSGSLPSRLRIAIDGELYERALDDAFVQQGDWRAWDPPLSARHAIYQDLHSRLQRSLPEVCSAAVAQLKLWAGLAAEPARPSHRLLSARDLTLLANHPLITIGAHTRSHPALSRLKREDQIAEIAAAKPELEDLAGRAVRHFSYPYGRKEHYSDEVVQIVRDAGFACACCFDSGRVGTATDPYRLPRCGVSDWDGGEFEKQLWRWFRN